MIDEPKNIAELNDLEISRDVKNPFPGLRPFDLDESHLFFGREGQSDEVLEKLSRNRFVAVVGSSGSGKSSLVYCGVIPLIYGGFMTASSSRWKVITSRPGSAPIDNLAQSLLSGTGHWDGLNEDEKFVKKTISATLLRSSSLGLIESIKHLKKGDESFLILIDQFEELFRYQREDDQASNESAAFLKLLIEATNQSSVPIYVALTMRSDFIGDCAQYPELTNKINKSHYLIPQMTREQRRRAIEGPIAVGEGGIESGLVQRILNDVGDNVDQLPLMQHALMRTWQYAVQNNLSFNSLSIADYESVGTINEALSLHANEAYNELTDEQHRICEVLFKSITEKKGGDRFGIRRPTSIKVIAAIAEVEESEVIEVINRFRDPSRSLLTPTFGIELNSDSVIDISHESLMRIWDRLRLWVEEEADAAQMYLRLCDVAEKYQVGRAGLWRPPDLQLALNWKDKYDPSVQWARRYDPAFERAMVFLRTSKEEYDAEQKGKEEQQRRRLRTARIVTLLVSAIAIIAIGFLVFAIIQRAEAIEQEKLAIEKTIEAQENEQKAIVNAEAARKSELKAKESAALAEEKRLEADSLRLVAVQKGEELLVALANERNQKLIADQQSVEARKQRDNARIQTNIAVREKQKADSASSDATNRRYQAIAQSMAVKSLQLKDPELKALNAYQAYQFNKKYGGDTYDSYVFEGLYYANKELSGEEQTLFSGHGNSINDMYYDKASESIYTASSDGRLYKWNANDPQESPEIIIFNTNIENRSISVSNDKKWLAMGTTGNSIQLFDISKKSPTHINIEEHVGTVWDIEFMPDNSGFYYTGADSSIWFYDFNESKMLLKGATRFNAIDLNSDGSLLAAGSNSGIVSIWRTDNFEKVIDLPQGVSNAVNVVEFNHQGTKLVASHMLSETDAELSVWNTSDWSQQIVLSGHESRMDKIRFSDDDRLMASGSHDGSVRLWQMNKLNVLPTVLNDHDGWVMSLDFTKNDEYIVTGTVEGQMRLWPTRSDMFVKDFCNKLSRNMTEKEWNQFVADDIDYIATCSGLLDK